MEKAVEEKLNTIYEHLQNRFPESDIETKFESGQWYKFRIGDVPPALFLEFKHEFVFEGPPDQLIEQLEAYDLEGLMPESGKARYAIFLGHIQPVTDEA